VNGAAPGASRVPLLGVNENRLLVLPIEGLVATAGGAVGTPLPKAKAGGALPTKLSGTALPVPLTAAGRSSSAVGEPPAPLWC